ncbi:MAG: hypothetical protein S0880_18930 [Actinomycetota bacterium]|nr:hypothetical protein [Actinomycetota bacterium]
MRAIEIIVSVTAALVPLVYVVFLIRLRRAPDDVADAPHPRGAWVAQGLVLVALYVLLLRELPESAIILLSLPVTMWFLYQDGVRVGRRHAEARRR